MLGLWLGLRWSEKCPKMNCRELKSRSPFKISSHSFWEMYIGRWYNLPTRLSKWEKLQNHATFVILDGSSTWLYYWTSNWQSYIQNSSLTCRWMLTKTTPWRKGGTLWPQSARVEKCQPPESMWVRFFSFTTFLPVIGKRMVRIYEWSVLGRGR